MSKNIEITFNLDNGRTMQLSISSPKADLTRAVVDEKAADIMPILETSSGAHPVSVKQVKITETTSTVIE